MYWFNAGIIDAKGVHHPTVIALELGMSEPRNEVLFLLSCLLMFIVCHNAHVVCRFFIYVIGY